MKQYLKCKIISYITSSFNEFRTDVIIFYLRRIKYRTDMITFYFRRISGYHYIDTRPMRKDCSYEEYVHKYEKIKMEYNNEEDDIFWYEDDQGKKYKSKSDYLATIRDEKIKTILK